MKKGLFYVIINVKKFKSFKIFLSTMSYHGSWDSYVIEVERMMAIVVVGYLKTTNGIINNGIN